MNFSGAAIGSIAAVFIVSFIESTLPVVSMTKDVDPRMGDGYFSAVVQGRKIRDCKFIPDSYVGWYEAKGVWYETPFSFIDDVTPDSTRPSSWGVQSFGRWEWSGIPKDASRVRLSMQHECKGQLEFTIIPSSGGFEIRGEQ